VDHESDAKILILPCSKNVVLAMLILKPSVSFKASQKANAHRLFKELRKLKSLGNHPNPGLGNLFAITGRMICALSLARRKSNFILEVYLYLIMKSAFS